jgi:dTDP-4-amino-4,6-dideoxygalactose transaminase
MNRIALSEPWVGPADREKLLEAFDAGWVGPLGPYVDAFEKAVATATGRSGAVATSSGTAALHLALLALGIGPQAKVLCSTFTFAATANPVRYTGAIPTFVDSDPCTWNIDPRLVEEELERMAKRGAPAAAVIAVDLYGQCADYDALAAICTRFGVPLVIDAAESLGALYKGRPAGSGGALAVVSFNGNKIITTGGGGMLLSDQKEWIGRARFLATQAREPAPHYEHEQVGYNYRLSSLGAALGLGQLTQLVSRVERKRSIRSAYVEALADLPGVTFMPEAAYGRASFWLTCIRIEERAFGPNREAVRRALGAAGIESRPVWKPMHLQPVYSQFRCVGGAVSEGIFQEGLCLPSSPQLTSSEQARVVEVIRSVARGQA